MMAMVTIRVDIRYDLAGAGADVVWGHGLTSSMASEDELGLFDWSTIRSTHRVLRYDARGHGDSGSTPDPHDLSWSELALDQLALADQLGIGTFVAGGAPMGCATALHAAVTAPERIRGLLLVIPPTAWESRAAQIDTYRAMADLIEAGDHQTLLAAQRPSPCPTPSSTIRGGRPGFRRSSQRRTRLASRECSAVRRPPTCRTPSRSRASRCRR